MGASASYIVISILALAVIALFVFFIRKDKRETKLTPLAGLAFAFILAGILFWDSRLVGYSLFGVGIILAIVDIVLKFKNKGARLT